MPFIYGADDIYYSLQAVREFDGEYLIRKTSISPYLGHRPCCSKDSLKLNIVSASDKSIRRIDGQIVQ